MGSVYVIEFPDGRKYVGSTNHPIKYRDRKHVDVKPNIPLNNNIRRHGLSDAEVLFESENVLELAQERERMIRTLGTTWPRGLNRRSHGHS